MVASNVRVSGSVRRADRRWCLSWRSDAMSAPSYWYFTTKREAVAALDRMVAPGHDRGVRS